MNLRRLMINAFRITVLIFISISIVNLLIEIYATSEFKNQQNVNSLVKKIQQSEVSSDFIRQHAKDQIDGSNKIHFHYALGYVLDHTNAKSFHGDASGRRITPQKYLEGKKTQGVLFGASMTWGYFVPDDGIISSFLSQKWKNTGIDNYSIQGKTLEQIKLYWKYEAENLKDKDFIIVVGGSVDVAKYCQLEPQQLYVYHEKMQLGISRIAKNLFSSRSENTYGSFCRDEKDIDIVVQRILNSIESLELQAKTFNVPIYIVIPPVPYSNFLNVSNLQNDPQFNILQKKYTKIFDSLNRSINEKNYPYVLNLMNSFDHGDFYFIDREGHLNSKGHEKLATEIVKRLGDTVPQSPN